MDSGHGRVHLFARHQNADTNVKCRWFFPRIAAIWLIEAQKRHLEDSYQDEGQTTKLKTFRMERVQGVIHPLVCMCWIPVVFPMVSSVLIGKMKDWYEVNTLDLLRRIFFLSYACFCRSSIYFESSRFRVLKEFSFFACIFGNLQGCLDRSFFFPDGIICHDPILSVYNTTYYVLFLCSKSKL